MKRIFTLLFFYSFIISAVKSDPITEEAAAQVGSAFLNITNGSNLKTSNSLQLVYTATSKANDSSTSGSRVTPSAYYYVFNLTDQKGFIIISGDDDVSPILAYSAESSFNPSEIPANVSKWLEDYKGEIRHVIANKIKATDEIKKSWENLLKNKGSKGNPRLRTTSVNPLVKTKWNQNPFYNDLCPFDTKQNEKTIAGCVATAMAQIMKYWNYPTNGTGFHSYNTEKYGTLSANFANTTYNWAAMPDAISSKNDAVATLMYHCGISVDMEYGGPKSGGSVAYVIPGPPPNPHSALYALKTYFNYKPTIKGLFRDEYSDDNWVQILKNELDAQRPILYAGQGGGGGHAFVCDGYDDNNFFHFNWGWGGIADGYFRLNALNPGSLGSGGGTGGYNSDHEALIGIEPLVVDPTTSSDLEITVSVTASKEELAYGEAFSISTNIKNSGKAAFSGQLAAALFDENETFVGLVETKENINLPAGFTFTSDLIFKTEGSLEFLPGEYYVGIFYKPNNGNWNQILSPTDAITDHTTIEIIHEDNLELYAAMTPNSDVWEAGTLAAVTLDVMNTSDDDFEGIFDLSLYNLDGTFAATIEEKAGIALNAGDHFNQPISFSTINLQVEPGTYLLALLYKPEGDENYYLAGSTLFQNPIKMSVQAPPLSADKYEDNDAKTKSYALKINFTDNKGSINTTGANIHTGVDYDYYKIDFPAGSQYKVSTKLLDVDANGQTFTADAVVSYAIAADEWSEAYDNEIPGTVTVAGGTSVYFFVSPAFTGETGTYLLDIKVERDVTTGMEDELLKHQVKIYPNPAKDHLTLDARELGEQITAIYLINAQGQTIKAVTNPGKIRKFEIYVAGMQSGVYFVKLSTSKGSIYIKTIIEN